MKKYLLHVARLTNRKEPNYFEQTKLGRYLGSNLVDINFLSTSSLGL